MRCAATGVIPASKRFVGHGNGRKWKTSAMASSASDAVPRMRGGSPLPVPQTTDTRARASVTTLLRLAARGQALVLDGREHLGRDVARRVVAVHAGHAEAALGVVRGAHGVGDRK